MKTKQSLYDFIDKKIESEGKKLDAAIDTMIQEKVDPILWDWIDVENLEKRAQRLADDLLEALDKYKIIGDWSRKRIISDLNTGVVTLGNDIRERVLDEMKFAVKNNRHVDFYYEPLNTLRTELSIAVQPFLKKLSDLNKLHSELKHVIAAASNGEKAYKALIALGVDMKDYEESNSNLPAITKLSVDPCLINGNCI